MSVKSTSAASENIGFFLPHRRRNADATHVVGIDLGGTKILAGIADAGGQLLASINQQTAHGEGAPVLQQMARIVEDLALQAKIPVAGICQVVIGIPSVVSPKTGLASLSPNLALPEDRPLASLMTELLPCPVVVENDVNLAAFAEATVGVGKGEGSLAFVSFGTGVGVGLVISGELLRGEFGRAGEIAYLPAGVDPHRHAPMSVNGLYEDVVGTPRIRDQYCRDGETVADLFQRAVDGDDDAVAAVEDLARNASVGIATICSLFDPALTVIGGGIGSQTIFFEQLKAHLKPLLPFECRLETSRFGSQAGMIGALMFGLRLNAQPDLEYSLPSINL